MSVLFSIDPLYNFFIYRFFYWDFCFVLLYNKIVNNNVFLFVLQTFIFETALNWYNVPGELLNNKEQALNVLV